MPEQGPAQKPYASDNRKPLNCMAQEFSTSGAHKQMFLGVPARRVTSGPGRILDPRAREYDSLIAFERDFQRRRKAFTKMLNDLATERKVVKL